MTFEEFVILAKAMKAAYMQEFLPDEYSINVWYRNLRDIDYQTMSAAVQSYMQTGKRPPTIADLREKAQEFIVRDEEMYRSEGWAAGLVMKAARNSIYGAEAEYAKLPKIVQEAVGSVEALRSLGELAPDVLSSVAKGQFLASYRERLKNWKAQSIYSPILRQQIDKVRQMALGEEPQSKPEAIKAEEQKLLTDDVVSFQELPEKDENDSELAASIREKLHERIRFQEGEEKMRKQKEEQEAEQLKLNEDETYREFLDFAHGHGMKDIPTKTELFSFYGLRPGEFDRVLGFIRLMRGN